MTLKVPSNDFDGPLRFKILRKARLSTAALCTSVPGRLERKSSRTSRVSSSSSADNVHHAKGLHDPVYNLTLRI